MMAAPCPVHVPATYEEAARQLAESGPEARILAGGQSLSVLMHLGMAEPEALISLRRCPGARTASGADGAVRLGPRYTVADAAAELAPVAAAVADAAGQVASPHVRNIGSVVGNVCHADPGNDLAVPLLCHDASALLWSVRGRRWVALADLLTGPYEAAFDEDEFVAGISVPELPGWRGAYRKVVWRSADHPVAGVAAALLVRDGRVAEARLALGGAVGVPVRLPAVEDALRDRPVAEAAAVATEAARPGIDALPVLGEGDSALPPRYRRQVSGVLAGDAVAAALAGDLGGGTRR